MAKLAETLAQIGPLDEQAMRAAQERENQLTKPLGSLGRLEEIAVRVAGIQGKVRPDVSRKVIFVIAADHGVVAEGVSAYPQAVTAQMVANFVSGGAAINVLARHIGARVVIADVGVAGEVAHDGQLVVRKIAPGTRNLAREAAMTREQAKQSLETGIEIFESQLAQGIAIAAAGDMGIGNTTSSAAIVAAFTGLAPEVVTGRGTGVDDTRLATKAQVVSRALALHRPDPADAQDVLAKVGGFEIGALAGVMLAGAAHRVPVVVDGVISGAAALVATGIEPRVKDFLLAGHLSAEPGHRAALARLGLRPLLDLDMRLGEGTGAALAMGIVDAAVKTLNEMATFSGAGVATALET